MAFVRTNQSNNAYFASVPFTRGSFKKIYHGIYIDGPRSGQDCVSKMPIPRSIFETHDFQVDMRVIRQAQKIVDAWNLRMFIEFPILVSTPDIWTNRINGEERLIEPFIHNFQKFNSNDGRVYLRGTLWSNVLQALSHFSYRWSLGQMLLCDIQGGISPQGFVLSDPAICSRTETYGPTDLGPLGINMFFAQHECNCFCYSFLLKPQQPWFGIFA